MYPQRADITFGTYKYEALSSRFIVGSSTCQRLSGTLSIQLNKINVTFLIVFCTFDVVRRCQETLHSFYPILARHEHHYKYRKKESEVKEKSYYQ